MNDKALHTLEYDKIISMLVDLAGSRAGKEKCRQLVPLNSRGDIELLQEETEAALSQLERKGELSFSGVPEITDLINLIVVKSTLSMAELRRVAEMLIHTGRIKKFGEENETEDTILTEKFYILNPLEHITREITRCIISDDEMADDASKALKDIRNTIKRNKAKIGDKIGQIVKEYAADEKLQDNLITMRNGRYCVPVKSEYKNKIPGMIHDSSQSKNTFFIEPMAIVELNNEIRELEIKEHEEIERILKMLSMSLVPEVEFLKADAITLTELDAIFARGALAKKMRAVRPKFTDNHVIELKKARHPLIHPKKVVPIDLSLGDSFNMLIITGPNTGGKTVSLKTMGLFTLMGQAGLHIPALGGSKLGIFKEVYADIGDEQSIEQSLSTFSSHMTNTIHIVDSADENSLVLFDELGAGTDPVEGAALAMSILDDLNNRNINTMATTHYSELKAYALTTKGVTNGSCEFDVESLKPTYRLLIGVPGKSNAFAISYKLGLNEAILDHARGLIGDEDRSFEEILGKLDALRIEAEEARNEAVAAREKALRFKKESENERENIRIRKEKSIEAAKDEAREIVAEAKEYADEIIRKLNRQSKNVVNMGQMEEERRALRKKLSDFDTKEEKKQNRISNHKASDFKIGDTVHVISMDLNGTVHTLPNKKGECMVMMGIMQYKCKITDLEIVKDDIKLPEKMRTTGAGEIRVSKSFSVSPEINLVGMYPDDAVSQLEKYLDDAYLANLNKVTVIHGRGTGALRKAVQDYLKRCPSVKSYRVGEFGEGDHGVTIVEFK